MGVPRYMYYTSSTLPARRRASVGRCALSQQHTKIMSAGRAEQSLWAAVLLCLCVTFGTAQCPAHAVVNAAGTGCRCNDGYAVNSAGTGCEVFVCPYQNDGECDVRHQRSSCSSSSDVHVSPP